MYQPVPLNWMAGDDNSFFTGPATRGTDVDSGSENFWIRSNRWLQASH